MLATLVCIKTRHPRNNVKNVRKAFSKTQRHNKDVKRVNQVAITTGPCALHATHAQWAVSERNLALYIGKTVANSVLSASHRTKAVPRHATLVH